MSTPDPITPLRPTLADDIAAIGSEAERIRASGVLGEARLRQLFEYLVGRSTEGQSPKEIAIAIDVFGRNASFDVSQDALVRVYIHKLRKALDSFYSSSDGKTGQSALYIPRGEYRLRLSTSTPAPSRRKVFSLNIGGAARAAAVLLGVAVVSAFGAVWLRAPHSEIELARESPVWAGVLGDNRPIMIIVGDYYLIGEADSSMEVKRLIREYSVNSKSDLDSYVEQHPEVADRYMDVGLRYLPVSAAYALRDVMAVLAPANRRVVVTKMSDVEANSLKSADIVYIGYLSGMGILQDIVMSGSRFAIGDSYDEVIDKTSHHSYISQVGAQHLGTPRLYGSETPYRDYGLFAKFRGPGGNSIIVISGTRDEGVQQTAEAFTSPDKLAEFSRYTAAAMQFEALIEVTAIDGTNLGGKLLLESERGHPER